MSSDNKQEIGWGDSIGNDGREFVTLEPGDFNFQVKGFKRGRSKGNDKNPPCNMAIVEVDIMDEDGRTLTTIEHNLLLRRDLEWKICEFFRGIGARKHGETITMDWSKVPGASGKCKIGKREFVKKDGSTGTSNEIAKFYDADAVVSTLPAPEDF